MRGMNALQLSDAADKSYMEVPRGTGMNEPSSDVALNRDDDWPDVLAAVRDYWVAQRGAREMPARGDLSPHHLKAQLPDILLADVVDGGVDFRYRLVGTNLRQFFIDEPSGQLMSEALRPFGEDTVVRTIATYRGVAAHRRPLRITGSGSVYGQDPKLFDAWLAPLSGDGAEVNMILGTFIFVWDVEHRFVQPRDLVANLARR